MYNKQIATIEDFGARIKRGTFGLYAALFTEQKMNKYPNGTKAGERKNTPENPYLGKVFNLSIYQNACTGVNYYNVVKAECEREGIHFTDAEFAVAFPKEETYCESVDDTLANIIMQKDDSEHQRVLTLPFFPLLLVSGLVLLEHAPPVGRAAPGGAAVRLLLPEHLRFLFPFSEHRSPSPVLFSKLILIPDRNLGSSSEQKSCQTRRRTKAGCRPSRPTTKFGAIYAAGNPRFLLGISIRQA